MLDLRLACEQLVERAIPLLQLPRFDAHTWCSAGLALGVVAPCGNEAPAAAVADKVILQPPRQCMLAAGGRQPIGNERQRPIAQAHRRAAIVLRQMVEHGIKPELAPHRPRRQHRPPVPRADGADRIAPDAIIVDRIAV
jgi:hypothetical protein